MEADYEALIAPFIDVVFYITSEFAEQRPDGQGGIRYHKGLDIATPSSLGNVEVFSVCDGVVVGNYWDENGYGNYCIMRGDDGMGYLYAHLEEINVVPNQRIEVGELIGLEGTTGSSTGIHLHFEMQYIGSGSWNFSLPIGSYENPADFMGVPNEEGISIYYDGIPKYKKKKKRGFPWVLYGRKLRNSRI